MYIDPSIYPSAPLLQQSHSIVKTIFVGGVCNPDSCGSCVKTVLVALNVLARKGNFGGYQSHSIITNHFCGRGL